MTRSWVLLGFCAPLLSAPPPAKVLRLAIYPPEAVLTGHNPRQSILVTAVLENGIERDVTAEASFAIHPANRLQVSADGVATAAGDGDSRLTATYAGRRAETRFRASGTNVKPQVSFLGDIAPILTERGCSGSNCHGSVRGQATFKLSLFGARPDLDYQAVVKARDGRRVNLDRPIESLILAKPTMKIPHGGGLRFKPDSEQYDLLLRWLSSGAAYDAGSPKLESIRVQPQEQILVGTDSSHRLIVTGRYAGGATADMTRHVRYSSNDDTIASVDDRGMVTAKRLGETAMMIRSQGITSVARIAVIPAPPGRDYPEPPPGSFIDDLVFAKLKRLNILPSTASADETFVRRVYLDALGVLPAPEETQRFLASSAPDKRARLIDELLERPEFVDVWSMKWADLFQSGGTGLKGGWQLYRWMRQALSERKPYDRMVREMMLGGGSYVYDPTANFYFGMFTGPEGMVTQISQSLLGVRMDCAKCHDHPFESWTQKDFYGFGAFFTRMVRKAEPYGLFEHAIAIRPTGKPSYDYLGNNKEWLDPQTKQSVTPRFLGGSTVEFRPDEDIREKLAEWITSPRNPWFTRAFVNRVWKHYLGRGIVEPVDDFRISNPPSNPALLDALAAHAVASGYDLRSLCRVILNSRVYRLSSMANSSNESDNLNYSRFYIKRQSAESLFDAIGQVSEIRQKIPGAPPEEPARKIAVGSPNYFMNTFGRTSARDQICERDHEPTVAQAMHLISGDTVQQAVSKSGNLIDRLLAGKDLTDAQRLDQVYLTAYSRQPTAKEASHFLALLGAASDDATRKRVYQDLLWAVLNSKEFAHIY